MDKNENSNMDLKDKAERLKYMFDALNRQKKKYDRLKNSRGLSKSEYEQYTEVALKLSNFNEKCKNFIRPRKNGVGKFSTEDYMSWCHEQEGLGGHTGDQAGSYKGTAPGQQGEGKQMYYDAQTGYDRYKGEGGKPYHEMQHYRRDDKYASEKDKSGAAMEGIAEQNKEGVAVKKETAGAAEMKSGSFSAGGRNMPYGEGSCSVAGGQGRHDGKFYSPVLDGKGSPAMCSRLPPEHTMQNPSFYPPGRSEQGPYSFPPQMGAYSPNYFNFPGGFAGANGAMRGGHVPKGEDMPGMSSFRGNEFYYGRNEAPGMQRYYPQYMANDGVQMGNEFYYGKQSGGRMQKARSGYDQAYMSPVAGRMSSEMMSPQLHDRSGRFGQGLVSPRPQNRSGMNFGGRVNAGMMSPGAGGSPAHPRPGLGMMSPQMREGFGESRLGAGMMSPKMQDLSGFGRFGSNMMSPKMQDAAGSFFRNGAGIMSPKQHEIGFMGPDNYPGMPFKSLQGDAASHLSGALGQGTDFPAGGYQFDPKMFPVKERMHMLRGMQRGQFSPGRKSVPYPVPSPYLGGHKAPHLYDFGQRQADPKMMKAFKEAEMGQFFQDAPRSKRGEMADDGVSHVLSLNKMGADLEGDPAGKRRYRKSQNETFRQGGRGSQFMDGQGGAAGNLTLRGFEHDSYSDGGLFVGNDEYPHMGGRSLLRMPNDSFFIRGPEPRGGHEDGAERKNAFPRKYYDLDDYGQDRAANKDGGLSVGVPAKTPKIYKLSTKNQININRAELENLAMSSKVCLPQNVKDHLLIHLDAFLHEVVAVACAVAVLRSKRRLTLSDIKVVMANKCKGGFEAPSLGQSEELPRPIKDFAEHGKILELLENDKNKQQYE